MIAGASRAISLHGVEAMSLRQLARSADVPIGSMYHHFPNGKDQLVEAAVEFAGDVVLQVLGSVDAPDAPCALRALAEVLGDALRRADYQMSCPVAAAAVSPAEPHRRTAQAVFDRWQREGRDRLVAAGLTPAAAEAWALELVVGVEGAIVLCRAARSTAPLDRVIADLADRLAADLAGSAA